MVWASSFPCVIIAFAGQKGGSGKTTVATSIAAEGVSRGISVLLVDADPQQTSSTWGAVAAEAGLFAPTVIAMGATMHKQGQLPKVAGQYDLVCIDCPPRHNEVQRSALMVADLAVLPCGPSAADAWALAASVELVTEAQTVRPDLRGVVLITRKIARTALGKGARDVLTNCGLPVLRTELGYRTAYQEAMAAGKGVTGYATSTPAADEIRALFEELTNGQAKARRKSAKAS